MPYLPTATMKLCNCLLYNCSLHVLFCERRWRSGENRKAKNKEIQANKKNKHSMYLRTDPEHAFMISSRPKIDFQVHIYFENRFFVQQFICFKPWISDKQKINMHLTCGKYYQITLSIPRYLKLAFMIGFHPLPFSSPRLSLTSTNTLHLSRDQDTQTRYIRFRM